MSKTTREVMELLIKLELGSRIAVHGGMQRIGLHPGQHRLLEFIAGHPLCTQQSAADFLGVSASAVALSAKRLEKSGMVRRSTPSDNLRCNRLELTEAGRDAVKQADALLRQTERRIFSCLTQEETDRLGEYLERLLISLTGVPPEGLSIDCMAKGAAALCSCGSPENTEVNETEC